MRVELRIDRLVVDGLAMSVADGPEFRRAIEAELTRLIADRGLPAGRLVDRGLGTLREESAVPGAVSLGRTAAGAVYRGIGT